MSGFSPCDWINETSDPPEPRPINSRFGSPRRSASAAAGPLPYVPELGVAPPLGVGLEAGVPPEVGVGLEVGVPPELGVGLGVLPEVAAGLEPEGMTMTGGVVLPVDVLVPTGVPELELELEPPPPHAPRVKVTTSASTWENRRRSTIMLKSAARFARNRWLTDGA